MSSHSIDADIKVKWAEGQSAYSPATPEELLLIAIDLLVRDRGSEAAAKRHAASSNRCSNATHRTRLLQSSQTRAEQVEEALGVAFVQPQDIGRALEHAIPVHHGLTEGRPFTTIDQKITPATKAMLL